MKYEIKVRRMTDDYSGTTLAEAVITIPDYDGLAEAQEDAVAIVASGAVSVFAESMGRVAAEVGKRAARNRDRLETLGLREATADEAEAAGRDPGQREGEGPLLVPVSTDD